MVSIQLLYPGCRHHYLLFDRLSWSLPGIRLGKQDGRFHREQLLVLPVNIKGDRKDILPDLYQMVWSSLGLLLKSILWKIKRAAKGRLSEKPCSIRSKSSTLCRAANCLPMRGTQSGHGVWFYKCACIPQEQKEWRHLTWMQSEGAVSGSTYTISQHWGLLLPPVGVGMANFVITLLPPLGKDSLRYSVHLSGDPASHKRSGIV